MSIQCPECGFDNPAETHFCGKCGVRLGIAETPSGTRGYAAASPGDPNPLDALGMTYFMMGDLDHAVS
jgi:hypothetical protein